MVWANFTEELPRTNTVEFSRTTDGCRNSWWSPPVLIYLYDSVRLGSGSAASRPAQRNLADPLRTGRPGGRVWGLTTPHGPPTRDEPGLHPCSSARSCPSMGSSIPRSDSSPTGFPQLRRRPGRHRVRRVRAQRRGDSGQIGVVRSRDGGLTWSTSTLPGVSAFAWEPVIAVDQHGTVGVIWYDLRNDRPGDADQRPSWFAHSHDGGISWRRTHVAGPTDLGTAPLPAQTGRRIPRVAGLRASPPPLASRPRKRKTARRTSSSPRSGRAAGTTTTRVDSAAISARERKLHALVASLLAGTEDA